jgi:ribosomal protein L9
MKVVILSEDTVIDDKLYRKGEVVPVDDGFQENIKRVVQTPEEVRNIEAAEQGRIKEIEKQKKDKVKGGNPAK